MSQIAEAPASARGSLPILFFTFILAFCSIVYELLLGQTLSAFLGNTVLRYSVTIGLYMFSMGIGALIAGEKILKHPVVSLQWVELALASLGAASVPLVFAIDALQWPALTLSVIAHGIIIVIGILTGLEIPLLIEIQAEMKSAASRILGIDYIGAFAGTVAFALWFYPVIGIFATALIIALLNALIGLWVPLYLKSESLKTKSLNSETQIHQKLLYLQAGLLVLLIGLISVYPTLEAIGLRYYLND